MHQVARLVGVSPMTVSRVLSGDSNVRDETRDRVQKAIDELGYQPNIAARILASAANAHIGLLYNNPSAGFLNEVLVGVLEQVSKVGCQLVLERCTGRGERDTINRLRRDGVGGIILTPPLSDSRTMIEALRAANLPFAAVAASRPVEGGLLVRINDFEAAAAITRYLVSLGHRDIGFIAGAARHFSSAQRQAGFTAALQEAGLKPAEEWIRRGEYSYRAGFAAAEELLGTERRPSAIFASNDEMAAATVAVAHRFGLDVPRNLTVVGFDDTVLATTIWPTLTTVRQPVAAMSRKATELLLEEIRMRRLGQTLEPLEVIMNFTIIKRESSAAI